MLTQQQKQTISYCKKSCIWFLSNFVKVRHPNAGILPFKPFAYQKKAIEAFREHRFNIFKKTRQCGISKISGAFALWFAMFNSNKTILIISRTNDDAMGFLRDNIVFPFNNLPDWMKEVWNPDPSNGGKLNEHEVVFPNGTRIKSLTSAPNVLRSNASSLNIIDEAAFIRDMDILWTSGWSTLSHGGRAIVISTTNGAGGWYYDTWNDAINKSGVFNPIIVNWWDMDWNIEYVDPLSGNKIRIAPRDNIRECKTQEEIEKYGPYWSPWLENEYRGLQQKNETWKFKQEILADFIGSGNTVIEAGALAQVGKTVTNPIKIVSGIQNYVHPMTGVEEQLNFSFSGEEEGLWIWNEPVTFKPDKLVNGKIVEKGRNAHSYVMGVDLATGKGRDYSAIEVFDIDTMEQVAEMMVRCLPTEFTKFIDRIGRWYNTALAVVERNNGGDIVIDLLKLEYCYPRLWRRKEVNDRPSAGNNHRQKPLKVKAYGFSTQGNSKPTLNKYLMDYIRSDDSGYIIKSDRLFKQLNTYVRKRDSSGKDTDKTEAESGNYDDLVISTGLAFIGSNDSYVTDAGNLIPAANGMSLSFEGTTIMSNDYIVKNQKDFIEKGGNQLIAPMSSDIDDAPETAIQRQLDAYTLELGAIPMVNGRPIIVPNKSFYVKK